MCVHGVDIFVLTEYCTKNQPCCYFPFNPFHQSNKNIVALHRGCLLSWGEQSKLPVKHNKLPIKHDNRIRWIGDRKELFEKSGVFQNFNPSNPYCEGVQGILYNYYNALQRVQLYGPTNFAPVINHVAR